MRILSSAAVGFLLVSSSSSFAQASGPRFVSENPAEIKAAVEAFPQISDKVLVQTVLSGENLKIQKLDFAFERYGVPPVGNSSGSLEFSCLTQGTITAISMQSGLLKEITIRFVAKGCSEDFLPR